LGGKPWASMQARPSVSARSSTGRLDSPAFAAAYVRALLARLETARARRVAICCALLLALPTLFGGFAADDYLLMYQIAQPRTHEWAGSAPFDLFRWTDPAHDPRLIDGAGLAWWTFSGTRIAFMRPISSLTHVLDSWLWPGSALGMHAQSIVWFGLLLLLAAAAYRRLLSDRRLFALAAIMFALDSGHAIPLGWISNRNALISGVFGIAALLLHQRRAQGASPLSAAGAAACFALCVFAGELGLGAAGYLLAHALFIDPRSRARRSAALAPYALIGCAWLGLRIHGAYGVYGMGGYYDPTTQLGPFLRNLPARAIELFTSQVWRLDSDLHVLVPKHVQPLLLGMAIGLFGLGLWFLAPSLRRSPELRFWLCGAALSAAPLVAGVPSDRLLVLTGLGIMPPLAASIHDAVSGGRSHLRVICAGLLLLMHLVIDPLALPISSMMPLQFEKLARALDHSLPDDRSLSERNLIVLEIPDSILMSYLPAIRWFQRKPRPAKAYWLLSQVVPAQLERRGPNVLRVSAPGGFFDPDWKERSPALPLRQGERVVLREMTIEIVEVTPDGRPSVCDVRFVRPLEAPGYEFMTWQAGRLVRVKMPAVGEVVGI
jgi:hypothetical protein